MDSWSTDDIVKEWMYPCKICGKRMHDTFLEDRVHKNIRDSFPNFIIFLGRFRSGKSWSSNILLSKFFPSTEQFNEEHIIWDFDGLIDFYKNHKECGASLEEIGVQYDRMNFWEISFRVFKFILETQGYKGNTLFMNVPDMYYVPPFLHPVIDYRVITQRFGDHVFAKVQKKTTVHVWKGWKTEFRWRTITIMNINKPTDVRTRYILDCYEEQKHKWNEKQLETGYGLFENKKETKENDFELRNKKMIDDYLANLQKQKHL